MEPSSIITIIIVSCIALERLFTHIKKSNCLGGSVEFNENQNVPNFYQTFNKNLSSNNEK